MNRDRIQRKNRVLRKYYLRHMHSWSVNMASEEKRMHAANRQEQERIALKHKLLIRVLQQAES